MGGTYLVGFDFVAILWLSLDIFKSDLYVASMYVQCCIRDNNRGGEFGKRGEGCVAWKLVAA